MSNTAFNYLTNSFLFNEASSEYSKRSMTEIERELNEYKKYIIDHLKDLNAEVYKDYNFIQPLTHNSKLPTINELLQGCIFLDTYLIDDPLFDFNIARMKMGNVERVSMGMDKITDREIKHELSELAEYMKALTNGVNIQSGYIKFYPFSLWMQPVFNPAIRVPDLSIDNIPKQVYEWFYNNIKVQNLEKNRTNQNLKISNRIVLSFKEDIGDNAYIAHYQRVIPEKFENDHVIVRFDGEYIPNKMEYDSWVNEEIIKAIKDKMEFFVFRDSICNYFNSPVCLYNDFQRNFYNSVFSSSGKEHMYNLGFDLNIPGLDKIDFNKAMEIRNTAHWSFVELQKQIKEDSKQLRAASDEKTYNEIMKQIENDYLDGINSTNTVLSSMGKLLSVNNIINIAFAANSYFTGELTKVTTGLTVINALYNVYGIAKEQLSNPMYFLKKISK